MVCLFPAARLRRITTFAFLFFSPSFFFLPGTGKVFTDVQEQLQEFSKRMSAAGKISQQDLDNLMKEEKIRIAMEKLATAQMQEVRLFQSG